MKAPANPADMPCAICGHLARHHGNPSPCWVSRCDCPGFEAPHIEAADEEGRR